MPKRPSAATAIDRTRIIFGCANFGGIGSAPELRGKGQDRVAAFALLDRARDLGISRFDTANTYGAGDSELILGEWLSAQSAGFRRNSTIFTKVGNSLGARNGNSPLCAPEIRFHSKRSLDRLRRIDVYILHQPDPTTPIRTTVQALKREIDEGRIGAIGLSNVDLRYVQEFLARAEDAEIRPKVRWVQNQFNYLKRGDEEDLIPFLRRASIDYAAASPLAGGLLAGRYRAGEPVPAGSRLSLRPDLYSEYLTPESSRRISELEKKATRQGRTPAAEALRFVLAIPGAYAVIGVSRLEQLQGMGLETG